MKKIVGALRVLCAGLFVTLGARALDVPEEERERLVVVAVSAADLPAADRLATLIDRPFTREEGAPRDELVRDPNVVLLVLDGGARSVTRYRGAQRTPLTRVIEAEAPSPYQLAFVAVELLRVVDAERVVPPAPRGDRFDVRGALGASSAFAGRVAAFNAALGLGYTFPPRARGLAAELGVDVAFTRIGELDLPAERELRLQRRGVVLRAGLERRWERLSGSCALEASAYRTHVDLAGSASEVRRVGVALGARLELRAPLTRWLSLFVGLSGSAAFARNDYRFFGESALRERRYAVLVSAGPMITLSR